MTRFHVEGARPRPLRAMALAAFVLLAVGCASVGSGGDGARRSVEVKTGGRDAARIEPDGQHGFTVPEDVRIASDVRSDYQRAIGLLQRGAMEEGVAALESVVERAPEAVIPRIDLGVALARLGQHGAAEHSLEAALALAPGHPAALNELGIVYRQTGRFEEARASYERALSIHAEYHYAILNLGMLCDLYVEDLACALENYDRYARIVTNDPQVPIWIADVRNRLSAAEPE